MGELFENLFKELKEKDRIIEFRLTHMPVAKADRNLIEQVAINLLSNAIKFTRKKENAIIGVGGKTGDNENIYWVKDNGVGFDMKYSEKLLVFFRDYIVQKNSKEPELGCLLCKGLYINTGERLGQKPISIPEQHFSLHCQMKIFEIL
jgi:light-regulated signal transduction histidine kinase (bacteriophytochrome)